jgi:hypothetical protein
MSIARAHGIGGARQEHVDFAAHGALDLRRGVRRRRRPTVPQRQVALALISLYCTQRAALARTLHYETFLQELTDEGIECVRLETTQPDLHRLLELNKASVEQAKRTLLYESLCSSCLAVDDDERERERKLAALARMGLLPLGERDAAAAPPSPPPLHPCAPLARDAAHSATLMNTLVTPDIERWTATLFAYVALSETGGVGIEWWLPKSARQPEQLHQVNELLQVPSTRAMPTMVEVRIAIGALRLFGVESVHRYPGGGGRRYKRQFVPGAYQGSQCQMLDPWLPNADAIDGEQFVAKLLECLPQPNADAIDGEQFVAKLLECLPQLCKSRAAYRGVRIKPLATAVDERERKRIKALCKQLVNLVFGCAVIGKYGRVQPDRLRYRAALLPCWADAKRVPLPPAVIGWLDTIGAPPWDEVLAYERARDGALCGRLRAAHLSSVARKLDGFVPAAEVEAAVEPPQLRSR